MKHRIGRVGSKSLPKGVAAAVISLSISTFPVGAEGPASNPVGSPRGGYSKMDCDALKREFKRLALAVGDNERDQWSYERDERKHQKIYKKQDAVVADLKKKVAQEKDREKKKQLKAQLKDARSDLKGTKVTLKVIMEDLDLVDDSIRNDTRRMKDIQKEQKKRCRLK